MSANSLDNLSSGWHDAERCERSTVDDGLTIDEHFVFAIRAVLHLDLDPQVTSQLGRHTGGVETRQSVRAITNDDPGHFELLLYPTEPVDRLTLSASAFVIPLVAIRDAGSTAEMRRRLATAPRAWLADYANRRERSRVINARMIGPSG